MGWGKWLILLEYFSASSGHICFQERVCERCLCSCGSLLALSAPASEGRQRSFLQTFNNTLRMAGECVPCEGPDLKKMGEEELWELINDNRHRISLGVRPCILIPYLRQARVLTEMDEDEIVSCHNLTNRSMRTSEICDLTCCCSDIIEGFCIVVSV